MKYRKRPVEIEAMQITFDNLKDVKKFTGCNAKIMDDNIGLIIHTLEGDMSGYIGDYIIKGVKGEFYPCRQDIFELMYDKVE